MGLLMCIKHHFLLMALLMCKKPSQIFGRCGMVDPNVFKAVGIDPEEWTVFAFDLGFERVAMRK